MSVKIKIIPWILAAVIFGLLIVLIFVPAPQKTSAPTVPAATSSAPAPAGGLYAYTSAKGRSIEVNVAAGQKIQSPLALRGTAAGWYFEGSFPVKLTGYDNRVLGQTAAEAQGEWTTASSVPFTANLVFSQPSTPTGMLILHNDNPSGLSANDDQVIIPVVF